MTDASRAALRRTELTTTGSLAAIFALRMFGLFMLLPVFAVYGAELDGATPLLIGTAIGAYGLMQALLQICLLYTSPSPRDKRQSRMPSSA